MSRIYEQDDVQHLPAVANGATNALVRGQTVQQIRGSYTTAVQVQVQRQMGCLQRNLLEEARLAGEDFYYGWSAGKDRVEGPSVTLALAAARCWGNCAVESLPVIDQGDSWVFTASFVDLQTGFTLARQFRQSKRSTVHGKMDEERKDDIRFQIGQSKAIRNVILNALPPSLVARALAEAKEGVRTKIEAYVAKKGLPAAVDLAITALAKCGINEDRVLARCGVANRGGITVEHLVIIRGDLTAIEGGQERAETLFPLPAPPNPAVPPTGRQSLKPKGTAATTPTTTATFPPHAPDGEVIEPPGKPSDLAFTNEPPTQYEMAIQDTVDHIGELIDSGQFDEAAFELQRQQQALGGAYVGLVKTLEQAKRAVATAK